MILNPKLFLLFFLNVGVGHLYFCQLSIDCLQFNSRLLSLAPKSIPAKIQPTPQAIYHYDYFYKVKRTEGNKSTLSNYYLNEQSFGLSIEEDITNTYRVFDHNQQLIFSFFQLDQDKVYNYSPFKPRSRNDWVNSRYSQSLFELTELPNKKFLGYNSTGKRLENKEWIFTLYFLTDTTISHPEIIGSSGSFLDKEEEWVLLQHIDEIQKNTLMYLDIRNKDTEEIIVEASAQSLKKDDFTFKTTDYKLVHQ